MNLRYHKQFWSMLYKMYTYTVHVPLLDFGQLCHMFDQAALLRHVDPQVILAK